MKWSTIIVVFIYIFILGFAVEGTTILQQILKLERLENGLNLTNTCKNDLLLTKAGLQRKELWSIKLIDASGRFESGFVWGNNYWTSSKELCQVLSEPSVIALSSRYKRNHYANLSTSQPPFLVNYQVVHIKHSSKYQIEQKIYDKSILHIGLCFPAICSPDETAMLVDRVLQANDEEYELIGKNYTIIKAKVTLPGKSAFTNIFFLLTIIGLTALLTLIFLGSVYTKLFRKRFWKDFVLTQSNVIAETNEKGLKIVKNSDIAKKKSFLDDFLISFSIVDNYEKLCSVKMSKKNLSTIHGLRAIGMVWIIAAHIYFFSFGSIDNMQLAMNFAGLIVAQPMLNAAINVDTFFALSGFLLSYSFYDHLKETEGRAAKKPLKILFKAIILRYLRLAIPYIPTFLFTTSLAYYLRDTSTFHFIEQNDLNCEKYWWRNFLFINNWWPMSEMCIVSSWYLSADFQCFLISIIILVISLRLPKTAFTLFVLMFLGCSVFSGYVGWTENFSFLLDVQFNTIDTLYYPTYTRIGGYIVGLAAGYIFVKITDDFKINKALLVFGWIVALITNLSLFLAQAFRIENQYLGMFFSGFGRPLWAGTIMWIVIMCSKGYGGIITSVLNSEGLIQISRLSFAAYLINPILIFFVSMISDVPFHIELVSTTITAVGYIYIIYRLAIIFSLLFEYPFVQLIKRIVDQIEHQSQNSKYMTHL